MRALRDLTQYTGILPYASEIFGVYQPLLGWKSKRIEHRITAGFQRDQRDTFNALISRMTPKYNAYFSNEDCAIDIAGIEPGAPDADKSFGSIVIRHIAEHLPPAEALEDGVWRDAIRPERVQEILDGPVREYATQRFHELCRGPNDIVQRQGSSAEQVVRHILRDESAIAGVLIKLVDDSAFPILKKLFYPITTKGTSSAADHLSSADPFELIDPKKDLPRVGLSPVGIVHLFRQYFFEMDTFLGSPVGHIWLSPGSSVELIEVSTRRTVVERSMEQSLETVLKTEKQVTEQDEIAEAVKSDNRTDTKLGASVNGKQTWGWGSASETASFDLATTQQTAREQSHKHMRSQSEKLATEIKQNYKTTFKTMTETTEVSSKRYTLTNATPDLINYELRRKMRQVGVQVQDIGTYLCWQTYVDDPGAALGVAKLMHIAKSPDLGNIPHPEALVPAAPIKQELALSIPYIGEEDENDITYAHGRETDVGTFEDTDYIQADHPQTVFCEQANYKLVHIDFDPQGADAKLSFNNLVSSPDTTKATFNVHLDHVNFKGQDAINVKATLLWEPQQDLVALEVENAKRLANYTAQQAQAYKKEFVEAAKDRIEAASKIEPRAFEDLREEERVVVYRKLIQEMLAPESMLPMPDDHTRHVVAELLNSIFDVDKMLYFVAPEWWRPRLHRSQQSFGSLVPYIDETGAPQMGSDGKPVMVPSANTDITAENVVGWGGTSEFRPDNYFITEDSLSAPLGSSLGWLLQLDGDPMRNAFLNAPWVKAVMPIRPGREKAALNWLKQVEGMNTITKDDLYAGTEPGLAGKSIFEVLDILAEKVAEKQEASMKPKDFPDPENPTAADSTVHATPVDKVYEHGFYPLSGGFRSKVGEDFEVFDQWVEILPTDQVVAVAVTYDPKTGRQV